MKTLSVTKLVAVLGACSLMSTTEALPSWLSKSFKRDDGAATAAKDAARYIPPIYTGYRGSPFGKPGIYAVGVSTVITTATTTAVGDPNFLVGGIGLGQGTTVSDLSVESTSVSSDVDSTTTVFVTFTSTLTRTTTPGDLVVPGASETSSADTSFVGFTALNQTTAAGTTGTAVSTVSVSSQVTVAGGKAVVSANTTSTEQTSILFTTDVPSMATVVSTTSALSGTNTTAFLNTTLPAYTTGYSPTAAVTRAANVSVVYSSSKISVASGSGKFPLPSNATSGNVMIAASSGFPSANTSTMALGLNATRFAVYISFSTGVSAAHGQSSSSGLFVNATAVAPMTSSMHVTSSNFKTVSILNSSTTAVHAATGTSASLGSIHTAGGTTASTGPRASANFSGLSVTYTPTGSSSSRPSMVTANGSDASAVFPYHDPPNSSLGSLQTAVGTVSAVLKTSSASNFTGLSITYTSARSSASKPTTVTANGSDASAVFPYHDPLTSTLSSSHTAAGTASAGLKASSASNFTGLSVTYTPTGSSGLKPTTVKADGSEASATQLYHNPPHTSHGSVHTAAGTVSAGSKPSNFTGLSITYTPTGSSVSKPTIVAVNCTEASATIPYHNPQTSLGSVHTAAGTATTGLSASSKSNFTGLSITYTPTGSLGSKPTKTAANASSVSTVLLPYPTSVHSVILSSGSGLVTFVTPTMTLKSSTVGVAPYSNSTSVPGFHPTNNTSIGNSTKGNGISNSTNISNVTGLANSTVLTNSTGLTKLTGFSNSSGIDNSAPKGTNTTSIVGFSTAPLSSTSTRPSTTVIATPTSSHHPHYYISEAEYEEFQEFERFKEYEKLKGEGLIRAASNEDNSNDNAADDNDADN